MVLQIEAIFHHMLTSGLVEPKASSAKNVGGSMNQYMLSTNWPFREQMNSDGGEDWGKVYSEKEITILDQAVSCLDIEKLRATV